jgi:hypothetical protein
MNCPKCGKDTLRRGTKTPGGKIRWTCRETRGDRATCYQTTDPKAPYRGRNGPKKAEVKEVFDQAVGRQETLVVTWAQNATPVHKPFLAALQNYCGRNKARLIVIPGRYKNPTSRWEQSQVNAQWWAPELAPYLLNRRVNLGPNIQLLSDVSTQPTATSPLTGFESMTHGESGVVGHPKLQMTVIPTPHQRLPKIMTTTGAVTVQNYTDTKAGKVGEFHHVLGAVIVERDGNKFYLRHVNANGKGEFCDLDTVYSPAGPVHCGVYPGLVFGDVHVGAIDPVVERATFGKGGLVERLNPQALVFHDLLDAYAVNPHHLGDPFISVAKRGAQKSNIQWEVQRAIDWLKRRSVGRKAFVVPSNHDDMLGRWVRRADWKEDPENAIFYLETALHMAQTAKMSESGARVADPFKLWVDRAKLPGVSCLARNESLVISGIECGLHGHEGPNGARGTLKNLSKLGVKVISGHSHTPGIEAGHYRTGTMTHLQLEYTGAVGSWLNAHVSLDPLGKRHVHICVDGRFWK